MKPDRDATIGAILIVKDDLDMVRASISHHEAMGVDHFLLSSRNSTPRSLAELEVLARKKNVHLLEVDLYSKPAIGKEEMRNARLEPFEEIRRVFSSDWILLADSDEFWVPKTGNLKDCVRQTTADLLYATRYNAAISREAQSTFSPGSFSLPNLEEQELITATMDLSPQNIDAFSNLPWILHRLAPKILLRSRDLAAILPGAHGVSTTEELATDHATDLLVVHFPFTTLERFRRKLQDIRFHLQRVEHNLEKNGAWHWRRWDQILTDDEAVRLEFFDQFFSDRRLESMRADQAIGGVRDLLEPSV